MTLPESLYEFKTSLKELLVKPDGTIKTKALTSKFIHKHVPKLKLALIENDLTDYLTEVVYCLLCNVNTIPQCPICNKLLHLRSFTKGFNKFCSKACLTKWQSESEEFREKSIKSHPSTAKIQYLDEAGIKYHKSKNYIILENYMGKGDVPVYFKTLKEIHMIGTGTYSIAINKEIYEKYEPTESEMKSFQERFKEFYRAYSHRISDKFWMCYFPYERKIIETYFTKHVNDNNASFQEKMFFFLNALTERPKCNHPGCTKEAHYVISGQGYTQYCTEHINCFHSTSQGESEIREFLDQLGVSYISNCRNVIDKELDIYIPEYKLAIEFNGCWYHSDIYKENDYHVNKWKACRSKGVKLLSIWEDSWNNKREICRDLIKNRLGLNKKIGARECQIKSVEAKDAKTFLEDNHLQGWCQSSVRLGLYWDGELVALMTFGKSRFNHSEEELLRYCCKCGVSVLGGAGKLLSHFRKHYNENIVSYCNCDLGDGNMYRALGMEEVGWSESWAWLRDGVRVWRLSDARKSADALPRCYSCGTLKFRTL